MYVFVIFFYAFNNSVCFSMPNKFLSKIIPYLDLVALMRLNFRNPILSFPHILAVLFIVVAGNTICVMQQCNCHCRCHFRWTHVSATEKKAGQGKNIKDIARRAPALGRRDGKVAPSPWTECEERAWLPHSGGRKWVVGRPLCSFAASKSHCGALSPLEGAGSGVNVLANCRRRGRC